MKDCDFYKEIITYSKVSNPAVLGMNGYSLTNFSNEPRPTIILPYMKNGSLHQYLHNKSSINLTMPQKYLILLGSALGMKKLHSLGIIHRDLKPENILLDDNLYPKISDFGCSIISDKKLSKIQIEDFAGTPIYMAPEIYSHKPYSYKVDVYSFSLVMYELLTGNRPFNSYESKIKLMSAKKEGKIPNLSMIKNDKIKLFLKECWSIEPKQRPSFSEIVEMFLLSDIRDDFKISDKSLYIYLDLFDEDLKDKNKDGELDFEKEIDYGNIDAIHRMAVKYYFGIGVEKNQEKAAHFFHIASQRRNPESMFNYALALQKGRGCKIDKNTASRIYKMASFSGHSGSMYNYAHMHLQGEGIKKDVEKAAHYLQMGIERNNIYCLNDYGMLLSKNLCLYNPEEAEKCFEKGANVYLDKISMLNYANFLLNQYGTEYIKKCRKYFKKAADLENDEAMIKYAFFLYNGIGLYNGKSKKDKAKKYIKNAVNNSNNKYLKKFALVKSPNNILTFNNNEVIDHFMIAIERKKDDLNFNCVKYISIDDWKIINFTYLSRKYEIQADNGNIDAMFYYGILLLGGFGVKMDYNESISYFKMAAYKGHTDAMLQYGMALMTGILFKNMQEEGIQYIKKSADNGNICSMNKYANEYYNGNRVKCDKKEAAKYFKMAADEEVFIDIKEQNFLFQSIIEKIYETIKSADNETYLNIIENKYTFNGDDMIILSNLTSKVVSASFYSKMISDGDIIMKNQNEINKYNKNSFQFDRASLKDYLAIRMNNLRKKVLSGDFDAIHKMALLLMKGDGIETNVKEGLKLLKFAADNGNQKSMLKYGKILFKGKGIDVDQQKAIKYFKMAADKDDIEALKIIKNLVLIRKCVEINPQEKFKYIKKLVEIDDAYGMCQYACLLYSSNKNEAAKYFKKSADKGNLISMRKYGLMRYYGDGIEKNEKEAIRYIKLSSDNRDSEARLFFGKYIIEKNGFIIDKDEALELLRISLDQENFSCIQLYGFLTQQKTDAKLTKKEGLKIIESSAKLGNSEAMLLYGNYLLEGKIIEMNKNDGIKYIKMSADNGNIEAMYQIGKMFFEGIDIHMNKEDAFQYLKKSADQGNACSMYFYGKCLMTENNKEEGIRYIKMAIEKENSDAMVFYSKILIDNDININEAIGYLKKAIEKENTDAMCFYGSILYFNKGIEDGIQLLKKSADNGNINAMNVYGKILIERNNLIDGIDYIKMAQNKGNIEAMYLFGTLLFDKGITDAKKEEGLKLIKLAADGGNIDAMFFYGEQHLNKFNTDKNDFSKKEAIHYLKMAADNGHDKSMFLYAYFISKEKELNININEAVKYFNQSIENGNDNSMLEYGIMLFNGTIIKMDKEKGINYIKMAAEKGNQTANIICQTYADYDGIEMNKKEAARYFNICRL